MPETLYLVDATSLLYRSFYAIRGLSTKGGKPTNAIFGTMKMAQKLMRDQKPEHVAFVFDLPGPTFRHEAFEAYKANRPETPKDLQEQVEPTKDLLRAMGLPLLELAGYEADDLIATAAEKARAAGWEVVIVTADKDLFQLVRPGVRVMHTKKEGELLDEKGVEELFGVPPERVIDVLALWGDPTDNIPGVPGIGEKGAKDLVREYGTLENVLAHAADVSRKAYREGLLQFAEQARFSRELATVRSDAPLPMELDQMRGREGDRARLESLYREFEFGSLLEEAPAQPALQEVSAEQSELSGEAMKALLDATSVGFSSFGESVWLSDGSKVFHVKKDELDRDAFSRLALCAHDLKPFLRSIGPWDFDPGRGFLDSAIAFYMLDPSAKVPGVPALARDFLSTSCADGDRPAEALLLARLREPLLQRLRSLGMESLYVDVERPLVSILARMEATGIGVDIPYFRHLGSEMAESLKALEREIHSTAGVEFNVASPKQVGDVLFERLKLPVQKKTSKTKSYSTDNEVLESLREAHPVVPQILEHRVLSKLRGTYAEPLSDMADQETGRLHATFNQTVAATGRLSSSDPNMQNIPIRGEWGPRIRRGFVAAEGSVLVGADYSQIELRILAHVSGDPTLKKVFESGEDIHTRTASEVFNVAPPFVTPDMRRAAKAVNFGILYGMGPFKLSREIGVTQKEAKAFIERYFARFSAVKDYLAAVEETVFKREEVSTVLGRRRLFTGISNAPKMLQAALLRQAINTTIQGSAADLIKKAMVDLEPELKGGSRLVLQVHDELVVESPEGISGDVGKVLKAAMEGAMKLSVPLEVSVSTGKRWDQLK